MFDCRDLAVKTKLHLIGSAASIPSIIRQRFTKFNGTKGWVVAMVGYHFYQVGTYTQPFGICLCYQFKLRWAISDKEIAQWGFVECCAFNQIFWLCHHGDFLLSSPLLLLLLRFW